MGKESRFRAEPAISVIGLKVAGLRRLIVAGGIVSATGPQGDLLLRLELDERACPGLPMIVEDALGLEVMQAPLAFSADRGMIANRNSGAGCEQFRRPVKILEGFGLTGKVLMVVANRQDVFAPVPIGGQSTQHV